MMHRDLKSPNVLLSEEGVAKIADVAMVRTQAGQEHLISAQPIMTPLWAAPEVLILLRPLVQIGTHSFWLYASELTFPPPLPPGLQALAVWDRLFRGDEGMMTTQTLDHSAVAAINVGPRQKRG